MGSQQSGSSAAKFLTVLIALTVAVAVASPWLLRSQRSKEESNAITALRKIHAAQTEYYGGSSLYGSIARLKDSNLVERSFQDKQFKMEGYKYFHSTDGTLKQFCAEAVPEEGKPGKTYGIDKGGVIYEFERNVSLCFGGVLTKTGGSPVR